MRRRKASSSSPNSSPAGTRASWDRAAVSRARSSLETRYLWPNTRPRRWAAYAVSLQIEEFHRRVDLGGVDNDEPTLALVLEVASSRLQVLELFDLVLPLLGEAPVLWTAKARGLDLVA